MKIYCNIKNFGDSRVIEKVLDKVSSVKSKNEIYYALSPLQLNFYSSKYKNINFGLQNISAYLDMAHTGDVNAKLAKEYGAEFTLIGHSEIRKTYEESNKIISQKISVAEKEKLTSILCVGESLTDFDLNKGESVIFKQITSVIKQGMNFNNIIIAYEPVWAIGTGRIPSNEYIINITSAIKDLFKTHYNSNVLVLYGGSVNSENISKLKQIKNIDGFLIGGASIKDDIIKIIKSV